MNVRTWLQITLATVIVAAAMWWVFRDTDMEHVWSIVMTTNPTFLLATIPVIIVSHLVRAIRWTLLLKPATGHVPLWPSFSAVMIGYASSLIIPRSGEIFRPWVLSRRANIPLSITISSVLIERLLDVLTLLSGLGAILLWRPDMLSSVIPWLTPSLIATGIVVPAIVLVIVLVTVAYTRIGAVLSALILRKFPVKGRAVAGMINSIHQGMSVLRTPITWFVLIVLTISMWLLYVLPLMLLMQALPWNGASGISLGDASIVLVVVSVGVTIAPTPGALGVYQGFAQAAMVRLFGASDAIGASFGIVAWVINYGVALVGGGLCFAIEVSRGARLSLREASSDSKKVDGKHL